MDDFNVGQRYDRPPDSAPSWFTDALKRVRATRIGDVPIKLHIGHGGSVLGLLDGVGDRPEGQHGDIMVELPGGGLQGVPCEDIDAFTLLRDPLPNRGDELRG